MTDQGVYGLIYLISFDCHTFDQILLCITLSYSHRTLDSEQTSYILDLGSKKKLNCLLKPVARYQITTIKQVLGHYQPDSITSYNILLHPNQPFGISLIR